MRNRRVQFLPVQWRTSLKLDAEEEHLREVNGLDNNFSLSGQLDSLSLEHTSAHITYRHHYKELRSIRTRFNEQGADRHSVFYEVGEVQLCIESTSLNNISHHREQMIEAASTQFLKKLDY